MTQIATSHKSEVDRGRSQPASHDLGGWVTRGRLRRPRLSVGTRAGRAQCQDSLTREPRLALRKAFAWRTADPTGAQRTDVLVHVFERVAKRGEVPVVEVPGEVLVDPASVDEACGLECLFALACHHHFDRSTVVGRT